MDVQQQLLGGHGNKISHQLKTKKYKVLKETEFCIICLKFFSLLWFRFSIMITKSHLYRETIKLMIWKSCYNFQMVQNKLKKLKTFVLFKYRLCVQNLTWINIARASTSPGIEISIITGHNFNSSIMKAHYIIPTPQVTWMGKLSITKS